jgi:hypothetical protein
MLIRDSRWRLFCASLVLSACSAYGSSDGRRASDAAARAIRRGMSIADVTDVAAAQEQDFHILGRCGSEGALIIDGDGGDVGLWAARGSPSGGDGTPEYRFTDRSQLRAALAQRLLKDGPCSELSVGFPGRRSSRFSVVLDPDGFVKEVKATEAWQ